jgi:hypothetical protein
LGERLLCKQEVAGSIPAGSIASLAAMLGPVRGAFVALALATGLVACGGTEIDSGKAEKLIQDSGLQPPPQKVDCPDGVEAKKGATFECTITFGGGRPAAVVTVHILDDKGRIRLGPGDFRPR